MKPLAFLCMAGGVLGAGQSLANDSTANFAAGGLVLTKTDAIEMRSEDLYVSEDRIAVRYEFVNTSGKDVTTRVAFPMPDIRIDPFGNVSIPGDDPEDPLEFKTTVQGRQVAMELEQKAFDKDNRHEITDILTRLGIPLAPQAETVRTLLDALPDAAKAELVQKEIAVEEEYDAGQGMEKHLAPNWTWRGTYHWEQSFAAGKVLNIEHRYTPSTGSSVGTSLGMDQEGDTYADEQRKRYCIDDALMSTLRKRTREVAAEGGIAFSEAWVDYVLVTGANWAKPIKDFRLVVDKGSAANLVSFCGEGVKKITPTQFEVRKKDFTPKDDLHVLILTPDS